MLGMYVVLENAVQMVCDYPAAYEGQPGFEFIQAIPTTWDETKIIDASIDEFIITARRKSNDWYIGSINNNEQKNITIDLNFLAEGNYTATLFTDAKDAATNPNDLIKETHTFSKKDKIDLHLEAGGGMVMSLIKQ